MKKVLSVCLLSILTLAFLQAQLIQSEYITSGLSSVTDIANAGDNSNRLFFAERDGDIWVNQVGTDGLTKFLDLDPAHGGELGLLGLVFHPSDPSYFFVNYTLTSGNVWKTRISRFRSAGSTADAGSEVIIMEYEQPYNNHNGGDLAMDNQYLYIASGDGGSGGDPDERAQDLTSPLGKILRIVPSISSSATDFNAHSVPGSNPYSASSGDTVPEIWHIGVRNPWRIHIDESDRLWIADVGQSAREEINLVSNNQPLNFGWDCREGKIGFEASSCVTGTNYTDPIFDYDNPTVGRSVTGGVVLPANRYPNFAGHYIFGDYDSDVIWTLSDENNRSAITVTELPSPISRVSTFGMDEAGNVYGAGLRGDIFVYADAALPIALISTALDHINERVELSWTTSSELDASHFEIERRSESGDFIQIGVMPTRGDASDATTDYVFYDADDLEGRYYYRLKAVDLDGTFTYSVILPIVIKSVEEMVLTPNPAQTFFDLRLPEVVKNGTVILTDIKGRILSEQVLQLNGRQMRINTENLPSGLVYVTLKSDQLTKTQRLMIVR